MEHIFSADMHLEKFNVNGTEIKNSEQLMHCTENMATL